MISGVSMLFAIRHFSNETVFFIFNSGYIFVIVHNPSQQTMNEIHQFEHQTNRNANNP